MAIIPDPTDIVRRIPSGNQPFASIRNAGAVEAEVGRFSQVAIDALVKMQERRDVHETSSAVTAFMLDEFELVNSYDQSEDYAGMTDDYDKKARLLMGQHANTISNPRLKSLFLEEQELRIAKSKEIVKDKAFAVEKDFKRAAIVEQLEGLREMVIKGRGIEAMETAEQLIASGQAANYIGEQEGVELLKKFRQESAVAWVESLPPEQQVDALKSDLADNLPSDKRAVLLRKAEKAVIASQADDIAQDYMDRGLSREEMIAQSDSIKDVKLQDEVKRRYANRLSDVEQADLEQSSELFDKYFLGVREGTIDVDEIPREDLEAMSARNQNNLFIAEGQSNDRAPVRSDPIVIDELHVLNEQRQWSELRRFFVANATNLSASDFNTWSQRSIDGVVPDEYESLFTELKQLKSKLTKAGYTGNNYFKADSMMTDELTDWHHREYKKTGKSPSDKMITDRIDQLLLDIVTDYGWWDSTSAAFEMSPSEFEAAILEAENENSEKYKRVSEVIDPNTRPLDFLEAYQRAP